ncbi:PH domain-containing protein [Pontibacillus sp. HMF3514]|uniref:PH domain-containing protein n=1 Tax=Pontibacillus sp. HMF3514 TaxID=2692425 RepID=UPI00131FD648|nr:PH domain-containing protein [Pontibacillus sp. HMF3514]QHE52852.1 hypothetical protein GS400_12830 [Pontibacillus sp. HMF3514]
MVFKAKKDRFFTIFKTKMITNMTLMFVIPFVVDTSTRTPMFIAIWASLYLGILTSAIMMIANIKYEFHDDHLKVKGGPLRKRIPYSKIVYARSTDDVFDGFRVLTASEAVEIVYGHGWWGNIKISPENQNTFIKTLKYYCPQAEVEKDLIETEEPMDVEMSIEK